MSDEQKPQRAVILRTKIEANSVKEMADALINLAHRIEREGLTVGCWGGTTDGGIYELINNGKPTKDEYFIQLDNYLAD